MNLVEDGTIEEQYRFKIRDCSLSVIILSCTVAESEYPRCSETFVDAVFDAERGVMTEVIKITRLCLLKVEVEVGIGIRDLYETQPLVPAVGSRDFESKGVGLLLIHRVIRSFGVCWYEDPVDDVGAVTVEESGVGSETMIVDLQGIVNAERSVDEFFGLEVRRTELVAGIIIEVGESRHA